MDAPLQRPTPTPAADAETIGGVKLFEFLQAPVDSSDPAWGQQWAEERVSWLAQRGELAQNLRRHELYQRHPQDPERPPSGGEAADTGFQAVSIEWFDSLEAYEALRSGPGAAELRDLDRRFWPGPTASVLTGPPDLIVGPPGGVPGSDASLICILRRTPEMDLAEFHDHWLRHHGGLFQTIPELTGPLRGYEQNHGLDVEGAQYDGVTQQWFDSLDAFFASVEVPAFADLVAPDTAYFLDASRIHFIMAGPPLRILG